MGREEQSFVEELKEAIRQEQFVLYLQPRYNSKTGDIYGAEVLVRWNHPVRGLLEPGCFLPQCEEYHLMCQLDAYVWEHACRLLKKWETDCDHPCCLSVKVSKDSLYHPNIAKKLQQLVELYQISKEYLQIEIEEDSIREDIYQAKEAIGYLRDRGFTVLLDDFSYGCSSISALNQIDVDVLKVDMKFFSSSDRAGKGEIILSALIKSVKWLGIQVLAECVESSLQKDYALACNCDIVQGFYFSKPMPENEFAMLLSRRTGRTDGADSMEDKNSPKHNLTILVIDDSEMERALLEKYLKDSFYIKMCENAEMGMAYLNDHKSEVDMILVDYMMPGMNGLEFLQLCKSDEELQRIPKIMITSNERARDQVQAFQAGAYDYLLKPLIPELVRIRIGHAMELNNRIRSTEVQKQVYQHEAQIDQATGVYNKITFQHFVEQHLLQSKGQNALLIIDIDNFKSVNDTYGHLVGDEVIKLIASELSGNFRTSDLVGRFGGDEFTVFMKDIPDRRLARKKAKEVVDAVTKHCDKKLGITVTVSIGVGYSKPTDQFEELFGRTDDALYDAKTTGKGKFVEIV